MSLKEDSPNTIYYPRDSPPQLYFESKFYKPEKNLEDVPLPMHSSEFTIRQLSQRLIGVFERPTDEYKKPIASEREYLSYVFDLEDLEWRKVDHVMYRTREEIICLQEEVIWRIGSDVLLSDVQDRYTTAKETKEKLESVETISMDEKLKTCKLVSQLQMQLESQKKRIEEITEQNKTYLSRSKQLERENIRLHDERTQSEKIFKLSMDKLRTQFNSTEDQLITIQEQYGKFKRQWLNEKSELEKVIENLHFKLENNEKTKSGNFLAEHVAELKKKHEDEIEKLRWEYDEKIRKYRDGTDGMKSMFEKRVAAKKEQLEQSYKERIRIYRAEQRKKDEDDERNFQIRLEKQREELTLEKQIAIGRLEQKVSDMAKVLEEMIGESETVSHATEQILNDNIDL